MGERHNESSLRKFANFCEIHFIFIPFPVPEAILCYYASYLASHHLSPSTITTYLSGIRHTQITLELLEPKEYSLPRLQLVQTGIKRVYSQKTPLIKQIRLPITPAILRNVHTLSSRRAGDADMMMLWAAATLCFFGGFLEPEKSQYYL